MGQSMTPRYQVLATELKKQLADGVYPVHSKIPSEHTLGAQFHVSRVTVRKALEILEGEGLLERRSELPLRHELEKSLWR